MTNTPVTAARLREMLEGCEGVTPVFAAALDDIAGSVGLPKGHAAILRNVAQHLRDTASEPLAWGVLDMDGECLHSVHMFQEAAENAAFGLGRAVPLGISHKAHPNMGMEHIGWSVQDSDGSWNLKAGKAMPTGIRLTLLKPVYVRKEAGE